MVQTIIVSGPLSGGQIRSRYVEVTDRIIAELEQGRLPWEQPWDSGKVAISLPAQRWLTYRQARALGGYVRRGEEGDTVCYLLAFTPDQGGDHD